MLQVINTDPPSLRFLKIGDYIKAIYIVEGAILKSQSTQVFDALVEMLAVYYIFDLNYPAIYGQLLGFLQQHILKEPYTFFKRSNFQSYSNKINNMK